MIVIAIVIKQLNFPDCDVPYLRYFICMSTLGIGMRLKPALAGSGPRE